MAYPQNGNLLEFFRPKMVVAANDTKPLCAIDIGASSADHGEFVCIKPCVVQTALFTVSLEAASGTSVAPTVVFTKRPTPGSATDEAVIATLTIPSGTAIGKTVYKHITPVKFAVGQALELAHTIGTGTPTGQGDADVIAAYDPEVSANNSNMIASA